MTICNVLRTMTIDDNTAIVVEGSRELFRNGMGILDDSGKPHEVETVGMDGIADLENEYNRVSLLIRGSISSNKIYV